jgi:tetratricopeptide (TPR) repeat protein
LRGIAHIGKGNYEKAVADASTAIRLQPKNAEAFILRGDGYHSKGDYLSAASDYRRALSLDLPDERVTQHPRLAAGRLGECAAFASALARSYADRDQQELARRFWRMSAVFQRTQTGVSRLYPIFLKSKTEIEIKKLNMSQLKKHWKKLSKGCGQ